jgi:hypothetical protein
VRWDGEDWIHLAKDRNKRRAGVNAEVKSGFRRMWGISLVSEKLFTPEEGLSCLDLVKWLFSLLLRYVLSLLVSQIVSQSVSQSVATIQKATSIWGEKLTHSSKRNSESGNTS